MLQRYLAIAALLAIATAGFTDERPVCPCYQVAQAPTIDGIVTDDPGWRNVPQITGFHVLGGGYTEAKQSVAMICHDTERLYIAMICEEPDIEQVEAVLGDGDQLFTEDSVEVFVMSAPTGAEYQFVVSAGGAQTGARAADQIADWNGDAHRAEASYSVEVSVPLASFGAEPDDGWLVAFCRNIWTTASGGDKFTCWPALRASFHEPGSFARLDFRSETVSESLGERVQRDHNADYRAHLVATVRGLVPAMQDYLPALRQTAEDDDSPLQQKALEAVLAAMRVERTAQNAEAADLGTLRDAAVLVEDLRDRSHRIAWQARMEQLLREHNR